MDSVLYHAKIRRMSYNTLEKQRAYRRRWRALNKDRYNAHQRAYNKQRRREQNELVNQRATGYSRKWRYGVTQAQFDAMFAAQGHRCAICRSTDHCGRGWCLDHNHATNLPRGVLCVFCNLVLGYLRDDPIIADSAAAYLRRHGA